MTVVVLAVVIATRYDNKCTKKGREVFTSRPPMLAVDVNMWSSRRR